MQYNESGFPMVVNMDERTQQRESLNAANPQLVESEVINQTAITPLR
jgi:hypothetical protein